MVSEDGRAEAVRDAIIDARSSKDPWGPQQLHCPAHYDTNPSLTVSGTGEGRALIKCHAGCAAEAVTQAVGLSLSDLYRPDAASPTIRLVRGAKPRRRLRSLHDEVVAYVERLRDDPERLDYLTSARGLGTETIGLYEIGWDGRAYTIPIYDETGLLVNIRRYDPEGEPKMSNTPGHGSPAQLYLRDGRFEHRENVFLCEGEWDALLLRDRGLTAVTGTGGAGTFRAEWAEAFAGKAVWIVYDCDEAGRRGAETAARAIAPHAKQVAIVDLGLDNGQDLTDWFVTHGRTLDELRALLNAAEEWKATAESDTWLILADVQATSVRWLWPGRLPYGKVAIIEGDPEGGKSLITLDLAARVSSGAPTPTGEHIDPGGVVLVCAEDDIEDTIVPRLNAADADLTRIATVKLARDKDGHLKPLTLPDDLGRLRRTIQEVHATLLVIDPITAYLSDSINTNNDASVRRAMTPLAEFAQSLGCAVLLVRHLNKQGDAKAKYRGGGSIAFTGAARSVLVVDRHPSHDEMVLARVKGNLAQAVPSVTYRVRSSAQHEAPVIEWGEEIELSADELLSTDARKSAPQREEARDFLMEVLQEGPLPVAEVRRLAALAGVAKKTLDRAAKEHGIHKARTRDDAGKTTGWTWSL